MKLFYGAGACSVGIHVLLEEIGTPYGAVRIDTRSGATRSPEFLAVNPKGKVPALERDDGFVVTQYPAIAQFLAKSNPGAGLLPQGDEAELAAWIATDYCCGTVHMQGFTRLFRPGNFTANEADHEAVKARGQEIVAEGFGILAQTLGEQDWIAGTYTYADSALFFLEFWGVSRMKMTLPPQLDAHYRRMLARPAVQRMLEQEGLSA